MNEVNEAIPILLVEDNDDDVLITKRALKKGRIGNQLFVVNDGEEAIKFLNKKGKYKRNIKPGLILLDLKMPKLDGFGVLKEIKNNPDLKSIPVVVLTTSKRDADITRAYNLGCNSYILKPVDFQKFIKTIIQIQKYWLILSEIPRNQL